MRGLVAGRDADSGCPGRFSAATRRIREKALLTTDGRWTMQNLIQNRRLIAGLVVAILVATAIVLLIAYSGGGGAGGYH